MARPGIQNLVQKVLEKEGSNTVVLGKDQNATIVDIISEGEIEGLVDGEASIFLDGTPIMNSTKRASSGSHLTTGSVTAAGTTVTVAADQIDNITDAEREVVIVGAGSSAADASATAGSTTVTTSSAFFAATDVADAHQPWNLRIEGAGKNGAEWFGKVTVFTSTTEVSVWPPISTTVSGANIAFDLVTETVSYNAGANTMVIKDAASSTVTTNPLQFLPKRKNIERK